MRQRRTPPLTSAVDRILRQRPPELIRGNFLPGGADRLRPERSRPLPSLGHDCEPGLPQPRLELDDFLVVYSYPWPGEERIHESVFDRIRRPKVPLGQFLWPKRCAEHGVRYRERPS